jgi:hypothetical protein
MLMSISKPMDQEGRKKVISTIGLWSRAARVLGGKKTNTFWKVRSIRVRDRKRMRQRKKMMMR